MSEQVGQLYKNSFEQSNSGKKMDYLKNIFSMIVFIFNLLQRHFLTGPLGMQRLSQKQQL